MAATTQVRLLARSEVRVFATYAAVVNAYVARMGTPAHAGGCPEDASGDLTLMRLLGTRRLPTRRALRPGNTNAVPSRATTYRHTAPWRATLRSTAAECSAALRGTAPRECSMCALRGAMQHRTALHLVTAQSAARGSTKAKPNSCGVRTHALRG